MENKNSEPRAGEIVAYSMGYLGLSFVSLGFSTYLNYFWTDVALIPLTAIAGILLFSRIFDGFTDILTGFMVDRTKSKYGKARPWVLWMALPGALSTALLFYVPKLSEKGMIIYAFVTYNLVAYFVNTTIQLPLKSMLPLMTKNSEKRLTISMVSQSFSTAATVIGNLFVLDAIEMLGGGKGGYFKFFLILSIVSGLTWVITFLGARERNFDEAVQNTEDAEQKNAPKRITFKDALHLFVSNKWWIIVTLFQVFSFLYPAFMAVNIYYFTWVIGDASLMGKFMSIIFIGMLGTLVLGTPIVPKIGKIKASFLGMLTQMIGNFLPLILPGNITALYIAGAFRGIGPALLLGTGNAFLCDVVEYGEWKTGVRTEGLVFSAASMGGKIGSALGGVILSLMLNAGGYVGGAATQPASAISAITITFTWWHAFGSIVCTILLVFLNKLDKQMPQILADLEARKSVKD